MLFSKLYIYLLLQQKSKKNIMELYSHILQGIYIPACIFLI